MMVTVLGLAVAIGMSGRIPDTLKHTVLKRVALDERIGRVMQVVPEPDGHLLVADASVNTIWRIDSAGKVVQALGRRGPGPGELVSLYRIARTVDGAILALDIVSNSVTRFGSDGRYEGRFELPIRLKAVGGFQVSPQGLVVISGTAVRAGRFSDSAVHVFDDSLNHLRSFGPMPVVRSKEVLEWWGTGGISLTQEGTILFTRRIPYEIYEYQADGTLVRMVAAPYKDLGSPDAAVLVTHENHATNMRRVAGAASPPITAIRLPTGDMLGGRIVGESVVFDLFDANGRLTASGSRSGVALVGRGGAGPMTVWVGAFSSDEPSLELWRFERD
jgi:hypothetical protein